MGTTSGAGNDRSAVPIGGRRLDIEDVERVARHAVPVRRSTPRAAPGSKPPPPGSLIPSQDLAGTGSATARSVPITAINTGFGALAGRAALDTPYLTKLGRNLIASHTVGVGPWLDEDIVRATLLIRAQSLAQGRSGVRPLVVETLIRMLNAGVYPAVPEQGSLGASGDLAPLAHIALAMTEPPAGERRVRPHRRRSLRASGWRAPPRRHRPFTEDHATGAPETVAPGRRRRGDGRRPAARLSSRPKRRWPC